MKKDYATIQLTHGVVKGLLLEELQRHASLGCSLERKSCPVNLEPSIRPVSLALSQDAVVEETVFESGPGTLSWFQLLPTELQQGVSFANLLSGIPEKSYFEAIGNSSGLHFQVGISKHHAEAVSTLLESVNLPYLTARDKTEGNLPEVNAILLEPVPCPPTYGLLSRQETLPWLDAVSQLILRLEKGTACYQVMVQACTQDWHSYLEQIYNLVFLAEHPAIWKEDHGPGSFYGRLSKHLDEKVDKKQPFFAVKVRFWAFGENSQDIASAFETLIQSHRYGGLPFHVLKEEVPTSQIQGTFRNTFREGMLLNQKELGLLLGLPSKGILEKYPRALGKTQGILSSSESSLIKGIKLGTRPQSGKHFSVELPDDLRTRHCHVLGKTGWGKTTLLRTMVLQDIAQGHGVAVLDPHQDLYESILAGIPEERAQDVVLFDPCQGMLPRFNPLACSENPGKLAEDLVYTVKSWLAESWGDRMENLFRQAFYALICRPEACLGDLRLLLSRSDAGQQYRENTLQYLPLLEAKQFWLLDFKGYRHEELDPVLNKLGKIFLNEKLDAMFRRRENRYDFREIIDDGKILLCNLSVSNLGSTASGFLGSLLLGLMHKAALSRKGKKPFFLYVDELSRFHTAAVEDVLSEGRKFNLGMVAAHQTYKQLPFSLQDALQNAACSIWLHMDGEDAGLVERKLAGEVKKNVFLKLQVGEAVAKLGSNVVDFQVQRMDNAPSGQEPAISKRYEDEYAFSEKTQPVVQRKKREFDTF